MREVEDVVVVQVQRLYARQSRLIDSYDGAGWAATFTPDGAFCSPSYPEPVVGTAALVGFVERYAAAAHESRTVSRHVVTNVDVLPDPDHETDPDGTDHLLVHAYLQIVATPAERESRLVRLTTLTDHVVRDPATGAWRLSRRDVVRDDAPAATSTPTPTTSTGAPR